MSTPVSGGSREMWLTLSKIHPLPRALKVEGMKQWIHYTHTKAALVLSQQGTTEAHPAQPLKLASSN